PTSRAEGGVRHSVRVVPGQREIHASADAGATGHDDFAIRLHENAVQLNFGAEVRDQPAAVAEAVIQRAVGVAAGQGDRNGGYVPAAGQDDLAVTLYRHGSNRGCCKSWEGHGDAPTCTKVAVEGAGSRVAHHTKRAAKGTGHENLAIRL